MSKDQSNSLFQSYTLSEFYTTLSSKLGDYFLQHTLNEDIQSTISFNSFFYTLLKTTFDKHLVFRSQVIN